MRFLAALGMTRGNDKWRNFGGESAILGEILEEAENCENL